MFKFFQNIFFVLASVNLAFSKSTCILKTIKIRSVHYLVDININQDKNQNYID